MRTSSVGYPFWENIARVSDEEQMILLLIRIMLLVCPVITLIWFIYSLWEMKTWSLKALILNEIDKERERRVVKAYEKKMAEKEAEEKKASGGEDEAAEDSGL